MKLLKCVLLVFWPVWLTAQNATPNAGFENWNTVIPTSGNPYDSLHGWNTLNFKTNILGIYTCQKASGVDAHSGQYAVKLITKQPFGIIANGIASTAELITTPPYGVTGGIPFNQRPDSITGWFKNTPVNGDTSFIQLILLDSVSGDSVGVAVYDIIGQHSTYERFSAPVVYKSAATPNISYWILSSSGRVIKYLNSTLILDDIAMVFNNTAINETNETSNVFFDPLGKELNIQFNSGTMNVEVNDIHGRLIHKTEINNSGSIHLGQLKPGTYFCRIYNRENFSKSISFVVN